MSVGFSNPIGGSNVAFNIFTLDKKSRGGAIRGYMPQAVQTTDKRYTEFEQTRFILKNAWNTSYQTQLKRNNLTKSITSPFRAVNNSGDLLSRQNYSCGGGCQSFQSRPGLHGLSNHLGGAASSSCMPSVVNTMNQLIKDIPSATCNVKFVYDSSDYVTYLKQKAMVKNFNDSTFGGDQSNASQSSIRAIRRY